MAKNNNFVQYLFEHSKFLTKNAFIDGKKQYSYNEFYNKVVNLTSFIKENYKSDKNYFLLCADNSFFFAICYLSIIGSGNIVIPIHPQNNPDSISFAIKSLNIDTVFIQKKYSTKFADFLSINHYILDDEKKELPNSALSSVFDKVSSPIPDKLFEKEFYERLAVIIFTSGSTGIPKGVMLTHKNLISNTESIIPYLDLTQNDIMMEVLPYSYCFGASWLHTITRVGGTNVINNKFMLINRVLHEINDFHCTGFAGVPSHFQMLLRNSKIREISFPSLRFVAQAGGKLANVFIEELIEVLPDTKLFIMYGQTEATARLSYLPPEYLKTKLGSIGKGIPNVKLEVLAKDGTPVKEGEIGSIVASGDNLMLGYWNDPEETSKTLINGKLWTGDLAKIDKDGFIFIVDREKHFIKSGGYRISPKEIEDHIAKLKFVIECAVIGVDDEILGEAPKAYVVIKNQPQTSGDQIRDEITTHCKKALASFKVPKYIEFISALPKNSSNKILVNELKKINN